MHLGDTSGYMVLFFILVTSISVYVEKKPRNAPELKGLQPLSPTQSVKASRKRRGLKKLNFVNDLENLQSSLRHLIYIL